MKQKKGQNGITLIALIIIIVVLVILAGVSIATLTGNNGILTQVNDAKERTEKASIIEQVQMDILGQQVKNKNEELTKDQLKTILDKYFKDVPEDYTKETVLTTNEEYGNYQIAVSDIYNKDLNEDLNNNISKEQSFVGYYADTDGDEVADGIIYADLAMGNTGSGQWGNSDGIYTITPVTVKEDLKDYYICNPSFEDGFGQNAVLSATGSGLDRFYVMALSDVDATAYYSWYSTAAGKMIDYDTATSVDFGTGRTNTETMIAKWNGSEYGNQSSNDMWGITQLQQSDNDWFVPSRAEWAAFGGELGIGLDYASKGLSKDYWPSSQGSEGSAWSVDSAAAMVSQSGISQAKHVRLSTTF